MALHINNTGTVATVLRKAGNSRKVAIWRFGSGVIETIATSRRGSFLPGPISDAGQLLYRQFPGNRLMLFGRGFFPAPSRNYLWDPQRGRIRLDGYARLHRGEELYFTDLNNRGDVVGFVRQRDGRSEGILLEPIVERWEKR